MPLRTRRSLSRRPRGFTIVEVVIAATLSTVLGLAVASVLVSSSKLSKETLVKAQTEQQVRDLNQTVTRFVRSASPLRRCASPDASTPANACLVVVSDGALFAATPTASEIVFYAYTDPQADPLAAPDRVTVRTRLTDERAAVLEVLVEASNVTYTEAWRGTGLPEVVRTLTLRPPSPSSTELPEVFTFLDASGETLTAPNASDVRVVVFDPQVRVLLDGVERRFGSPVFVVLPSQGFGG